MVIVLPMTQTTWSETDALAPKGPSLAQLMLARGAQLHPVARRTVEQAVTAAEVVAEAEAIVEDVAVIAITEVPDAAAPADDEPQPLRVARPFNASPIVIDGEVW